MKVVVNVDCKYDGYAKYFASLLTEELARTYPDLSIKLEKLLDMSKMSYNAFKEFFGTNPMKLLSNHLGSVYRINEDVRIVFNRRIPAAISKTKITDTINRLRRICRRRCRPGTSVTDSSARF